MKDSEKEKARKVEVEVKKSLSQVELEEKAKKKDALKRHQSDPILAAEPEKKITKTAVKAMASKPIETPKDEVDPVQHESKSTAVIQCLQRSATADLPGASQAAEVQDHSGESKGPSKDSKGSDEANAEKEKEKEKEKVKANTGNQTKEKKDKKHDDKEKKDKDQVKEKNMMRRNMRKKTMRRRRKHNRKRSMIKSRKRKR